MRRSDSTRMLPRVRRRVRFVAPGAAREARSGPSGYFALPILYGNRLAEKPDATANRKAAVLRVNTINQDETFDGAATAADDDEIKDLAR